MAATGNEAVTLKQLKSWGSSVLNGGGLDAYPVGSIYMSVNSTSPSTLFGGTWERIQDRFLLCAGSTYAAGGTGGEASHTLTVNEMPEHVHSVSAKETGNNTKARIQCTTNRASSYGITQDTGPAGQGQAHNNMPPYLAVYVWKRTA